MAEISQKPPKNIAHEGGPLRYLCGQTINPTAMICTFLESPIDLDVHTKKRFALLAKIVEIDVAEVDTQNNEICSCGPDRRGSSPVDDNFCFVLFFLTFWYVMHYFSFSCSDFEKSAKIDVQECKLSRFSLLV